MGAFRFLSHKNPWALCYIAQREYHLFVVSEFLKLIVTKFVEYHVSWERALKIVDLSNIHSKIATGPLWVYGYENKEFSISSLFKERSDITVWWILRDAEFASVQLENGTVSAKFIVITSEVHAFYIFTDFAPIWRISIWHFRLKGDVHYLSFFFFFYQKLKILVAIIRFTHQPDCVCAHDTWLTSYK